MSYDKFDAVEIVDLGFGAAVSGGIIVCIGGTSKDLTNHISFINGSCTYDIIADDDEFCLYETCGKLYVWMMNCNNKDVVCYFTRKWLKDNGKDVSKEEVNYLIEFAFESYRLRNASNPLAEFITEKKEV